MVDSAPGEGTRLRVRVPDGTARPSPVRARSKIGAISTSKVFKSFEMGESLNVYMRLLGSAVPMVFRVTFAAFICVAAIYGQQVKTRLYSDSKECFNTYHLETGRILTSHGVVEDPTINAMMKDAVATQMSALKIGGADNNADLVVRFTGGNGAGCANRRFCAGHLRSLGHRRTGGGFVANVQKNRFGDCTGGTQIK